MIDRETVEVIKAGRRAEQSAFFGMLDDYLALQAKVETLEAVLNYLVDEMTK